MPDPKIIYLRVTTGQGDTRTMLQFIDEVKGSLRNVARNVTVLGRHILVDGEQVSTDENGKPSRALTTKPSPQPPTPAEPDPAGGNLQQAVSAAMADALQTLQDGQPTPGAHTIDPGF